MGTRVSNAASTANNIDHAALEGEMVARASKTRGPLSANGQGRSGGALLCTRAQHEQHNTQARTHRQKTTVGKR